MLVSAFTLNRNHSEAAYRLQRTIAFALALLAVLYGAGCAKIGEPQPPEVRIPRPASDLAVRQVSDSIVLTFSKTELNTNGTKANLKRIDVLRLTEDEQDKKAGNLAYERFVTGAVRIASIPQTQFPEYLRDKAFTVQDRIFGDKPATNTQAFRYAVLFVNNKNQSAGLSNQVRISPVPVPPPPTGLSIAETQKIKTLRWIEPVENSDGSRPPRIAGYNIYRTDRPDQVPSAPLNSEPVKIPEYQDKDFRFDTTYYYGVSTVAGPQAESVLSGRLRVESKDVYPPAAPTDFSAILQGDAVILMWEPSSSEDLAGYCVYRIEKGTNIRKSVQTDLIRTLSIRDNGIEPGKEYGYEIQAVDDHGNESPAIKADVEKP